MNAAMVVDGEPLSKKKQSNVLAKQYAEKSTRHPNAPRINMPRIPKVPLALISMGEPDAALKAMHMGSAPGPVACTAMRCSAFRWRVRSSYLCSSTRALPPG